MPEHPLATKRGIEAFVNLLHADQVWSKATTAQQTLMRQLCAPILHAVENADKNTYPRIEALRPEVQAPERTLKSMRGKGLVDGDNRLTAEAIHAWYWTVRVERSRE